MKSFSHKLALCFLSSQTTAKAFALTSLIILCYSCTPDSIRTTHHAPRNTIIAIEPKPSARLGSAKAEAGAGLVSAKLRAVAGQKTMETRPVADIAPEPTDTVAEIADYKIIADELAKRTIFELRPDPYRYIARAEPVDVNDVLMKILAEKAMAIEARSQNYLQHQEIQESLKEFKEKTPVNLLLQAYLKGKIITVSGSEIEQKIKANPQLDDASAKAMLDREKTLELVDQFYSQLCEKFHVQKFRDNFPKVIQIHQRLFKNARQIYSIKFIGEEQIKNELTPEEKQMPLATYDNGKLTLKGWFDALCNISPPSRPKDLNTTEGVEKLLDNALKIPILVAEAHSQGLEKDETFLKQLKEQEDAALIGKVVREKTRDIKDPNQEQIIAYFDNHKEDFGTHRSIMIEQIWCPDLSTARKVKAELNRDRDFEAVAQQYSFEKQSKPFYTSVDNEGMFFEDLWNSEPNEVVGPVKGIYRDSIKWRVVKILKKNPPRLQEYSANMKENVKRKMRVEEGKAIIAEYQKQLLKKYPYRIYKDKIINPLDIP